MSVWLTIPSARAPEEAEKVLKLWRAQGYKIALWVDGPGPFLEWNELSCNLRYQHPVYPGYSAAVNRMIQHIILERETAEWFVIGGDDTEPDMNHTAEEIAAECRMHFIEAEFERSGATMIDQIAAATFGVMQPTGDRFADACIEKIAGSAWIGREFARRAYGGNGPLWPEYTRFFMDEELQEVATRWGVFQQRRDLIHLHWHYMRESDDINSPAILTEVPAHLKAQEVKWNVEQDIFNKRKHARPTPFPGSEPIP